MANEIPTGIFNIAGVGSAGSLLEFFTNDQKDNRFNLQKIGNQTGEGSGGRTFGSAFNRALDIVNDDAFSRAFGAFGNELAGRVFQGLLFPTERSQSAGPSPGPSPSRRPNLR